MLAGERKVNTPVTKCFAYVNTLNVCLKIWNTCLKIWNRVVKKGYTYERKPNEGGRKLNGVAKIYFREGF